MTRGFLHDPVNPHALRRGAAGLATAALVLAGGCTAGDRPHADRAPSAGRAERNPVSTTGAPDAPSTTVAAPGKAPAPAETADLVGVLAPVVLIPEDARGCVAEKLAGRPDLVEKLRQAGSGKPVPGGVLDLGAACMQELHALPAFLDGLHETVEGGLSSKERACASEGYLALEPEVVDAAVADALGATKGTGAAKEIRSMLRACGVKVGG